MRFRHLLAKHKLAPKVLEPINAGLTQHGLLPKTGTVVDATIIAAPSSTKLMTPVRVTAAYKPCVSATLKTFAVGLSALNGMSVSIFAPPV